MLMLSGNCTHFRKKKIKCITEYDGYWGNYLNIEVCMDLLTEMDPLMAMNQYMTYNCTCKMQIKLRHYILCCDCEVTKFTCRNTRYPGTFAMFYKWDTLANTNITDWFKLASALSDPNLTFLSNGLSVLSNL